MKDFFAQLMELTRHELTVMLRTRRIALMLAAYQGLALVGGAAVVHMLHALEEQATRLITGSDASVGAVGVLGVVFTRAYEEVVALFAGVPYAEMSDILKGSLVLPIFLWGALLFVPQLVVITGFDQVTHELGNRAMCFRTLRASRTRLLLGKIIAAVLVHASLGVLAALAWVTLGTLTLDAMPVSTALLGVLRLGASLIPLIFCYVAITVLTSCGSREPFRALLAAFSLVGGLWMLGWMARLPPDHALAPLRILRWFSPSQHETGLWRAGILAPAKSFCGYVGLGLVFSALAARRLARRSL